MGTIANGAASTSAPVGFEPSAANAA